MIPPDYPRYKSLVTREHLADSARSGIVSWEGLISHGRGEAFDYLLGEKTSASARRAGRTAAALLRTASRPVISVNGNTAALAAREIAHLQKASRAIVEVNLFHRTPNACGRSKSCSVMRGLMSSRARPSACFRSRTTEPGAGAKGCMLLMWCLSRSKTATGARCLPVWGKK